jgi:hypothetical protein
MRRIAFVCGVLFSVGITSAQSTFQPASDQDFAKQQGEVQQQSSSWQYETQVSAGYSNVTFNHPSNGAAYSPSGPYIDANIALPLPNLAWPVLGIGISASGYWQDRGSIFGNQYSDISMISVEGRAAFPIPMDPRSGIFITPRIGVGLLCDNYLIQIPNAFGGFDNFYDTGLAFEVRPDIEAGFRFGPDHSASISVDASYMAAWGSFGKLGDMAQELRIGMGVAYRF